MARIGAHVSVSGGLNKALDNAVQIGANTIQIFGASPVRWSAPLPDIKEAQDFIKKSKEIDISPVFLHAPYLINLASPKENLAHLSAKLLENHLKISNTLEAGGVIFHVGSRGDADQKESIKMLCDSISQILENIKDGNLILENSAGAGNLIGDSLEELGDIFKGVGNKRLKLCLDTAHSFESGIITDFSKRGIDEFIAKLDKVIGIKNLSVIHLNDSKTEKNSNKDRHENIGEGFIGVEGFKNFINHKDIIGKPLILEVPGFDNQGPDKKNIDIVKSILN